MQIVACIFIADFPAWALSRVHDEEAIIVVASGKVVARSPFLRPLGVEIGMSTARAQGYAPHAVIRHRDPATERAVWDDVVSGALCVTPFVEVIEPGLLYLGIDGAREVDGITSSLDVQVGVSYSRSYALLAAANAVPGTLRIVEAGQVCSFLERFPVALLCELRFDGEVIHKLGLFGLKTLRHVAGLSKEHLRDQFGPEGSRLYALLHPGTEPRISPFEPPPVALSTYEFDVPASEPGELLPVLGHLVREAAEKLCGRTCQRVRLNLHVRKEPAPRFAARILPEPSGDARRLLQTAQTLLSSALAAGLEVEGVSVELGSLRQPRLEQQHFFEQKRTIYEVVRMLNRRFPGKALRAVSGPPGLFNVGHPKFVPYPEVPPPTSARAKRRQVHYEKP